LHKNLSKEGNKMSAQMDHTARYYEKTQQVAASRQVVSELDQLEKAQAMLVEQLTILRERLEPVLRNQPSQGSTGPRDEIGRVPLAQRIAESRERVASITAGVMELIDRLEL
jgi:hypothetical protein